MGKKKSKILQCYIYQYMDGNKNPAMLWNKIVDHIAPSSCIELIRSTLFAIWLFFPTGWSSVWGKKSEETSRGMSRTRPRMPSTLSVGLPCASRRPTEGGITNIQLQGKALDLGSIRLTWDDVSQPYTKFLYSS